MANKTSWKSISGNPFARRMWFLRLKAAGLYDSNCSKKKGLCKNKTKGSATALRQTKYANMSPPSRKGKETPLRSKKAMEELLREAAKKGKSTPEQRMSLYRAMRAHGSQRGATTYLNKEDARVKNREGKVIKRRYSSSDVKPKQKEKIIKAAEEQKKQTMRARALETVKKTKRTEARIKSRRKPTLTL